MGLGSMLQPSSQQYSPWNELAPGTVRLTLVKPLGDVTSFIQYLRHITRATRCLMEFFMVSYSVPAGSPMLCSPRSWCCMFNR